MDAIMLAARALVAAMLAAPTLTESQRRALGTVKQLAGMPTNMDKRRNHRKG